MRYSIISLLLIISVYRAHAEHDEVTVSPRGTFQIVQQRQSEGVKQILRFTSNPGHIVTLEERISWPADYYVSPDERWILRIQKSGSGDNISFLYRLDPAVQRVWRMEEDALTDRGQA